jgi:hypothetical protein
MLMATQISIADLTNVITFEMKGPYQELNPDHLFNQLFGEED